MMQFSKSFAISLGHCMINLVFLLNEFQSVKPLEAEDQYVSHVSPRFRESP